MRRLFVAGNWKMNTTRQGGVELAAGLAKEVPAVLANVDVAVCPPFPYLIPVGEAIKNSGITLGSQNVFCEKPGAFTGETAVDMLKDVGCTWAIIGHSERRGNSGAKDPVVKNSLLESDAFLSKKVAATVQGGLKAILCVGETLEERQANRTEAVLDSQMDGSLAGIDAAAMAQVVIAYEPVWAIGTGVTATTEQAESAHKHLRKWLSTRYGAAVAQATRILYGGSVKADNAAALLSQPNVDGALVGGASLKVDLFQPIIRAAEATQK